MRRIVVPPAPGLFSAFGLLYADVEHHYGRTFRRILRQMDFDVLNTAWDELVAVARAQVLDDPIRAGAHLVRDFSSWATVSEQLPVRPFGEDLSRAA